MAVVNTVDDKQSYPLDALFGGAAVKTIMALINSAAGDSDGSKYLVGEIPGEAKIVDVQYLHEAVANGTDFDLGIYLEDGTVVDADILVDGSNLTVAKTSWTSMPLAFLAANLDKTVAELVGHVNKVVPAAGETAAKRVYRIGLIGNTVGDGGNIGVKVIYRDSV